jgi:RNA polymerase sigma factor (sigma-70 family)
LQVAASGYDGQTDRELAIGAANGDQRAFAALYDRYFAQVYDLTVRMLSDPEAAADVTQSTFTQAYTGLRAGRVPEHPRAWLYTIAMGDANIRAAQPVGPAGPADEQRLPSFIEIDTTRRGARGAAEDAGVRKLVWTAAAGLSLREYALLDMTVRRDLSSEEIAEGLGISAETAESTVSGVRSTFQQHAERELLVSRGREGCPDLDALIQRSSAAGGELDPQALQAHVDGCETCRATVSSFGPPADVLSALALVPAPAGLKEVIWGNVVAAPAGAPPPPVVPPVEHAEPSGRRWWLWALLGAMALLGVIVALAVLLADGDDDEEVSVGNPEDIRALGLDEGDSTTETQIEMVWERLEGARAFSVDWSTNAATLPDEVGDLSGEATGDTSPELDPGRWYFHIRTQGQDNTWSDPEHVGPYEVEEPSPTPSPEPTEEPTPEPTAQPTQAPTPQPTPQPTAPPTPTPEPEDTPSPTP